MHQPFAASVTPGTMGGIANRSGGVVKRLGGMAKQLGGMAKRSAAMWLQRRVPEPDSVRLREWCVRDAPYRGIASRPGRNPSHEP